MDRADGIDEDADLLVNESKGAIREMVTEASKSENEGIGGLVEMTRLRVITQTQNKHKKHTKTKKKEDEAYMIS